MKINLQLVKIIIRLLILLILFVMLFIISAFLYSAKYWPDVYTYINANITIKRIPTLSELNITIIDNIDFTTEYYSTTESDTTDNEGFTDDFDDFFDGRKKREIKIENVIKDYIELPETVVDYVFDVEATTGVMQDSLDASKLKISDSEDVEMLTGINETGERIARLTNDTSNPATIFSWVATIFIKNDTTNQFDYFCDGVLLSERIVLTAGRCVFRGNQTLNAEDVLVFLGKRSLQVNAGEERVFRVTQITLHENFTLVDNKADNDLAALHLEEPVEFSDRIQAACLLGEGEVEGAVTSAWDFGITLVRFVEPNVTCPKTATENNLCATFGNEIPLCPSYGGAYAVKLQDSWCLRGIRTADPSYRGFCIEKTVTYTDLNKYRTWLDELLK